MRAAALLGLALAAGLALPRETAAQADLPVVEPLTVGVYAPLMYFPNSLARSQYAQAFAERLGRVTGREFRGRAFATEGEFQNQIKAGQVHFALVDAQHQIERGFAPIAQGVAGGRPARSMVLVARGAQSVADLEGKRLARVRLGRGDRGFVFNFLLQNQVDPDFFADDRATRDVQGALSLVKLGKADAAFAYEGAADGIFRSRPVPLPVFVRTGDVAPDALAAVKSGVLGLNLDGPVQGFSGFNAELLRPLAAALKSAPRGPGNRPVFARTEAALPAVPAALDPGAAPTAALPPVADDIEVLPPPADIY